MARLLLVSLLLLAACGRGGPRGDWRAELGVPSPNLRLVQPGPSLLIPPVPDLPPPR